MARLMYLIFYIQILNQQDKFFWNLLRATIVCVFLGVFFLFIDIEERTKVIIYIVIYATYIALSIPKKY